MMKEPCLILKCYYEPLGEKTTSFTKITKNQIVKHKFQGWSESQRANLANFPLCQYPKYVIILRAGGTDRKAPCIKLPPGVKIGTRLFCHRTPTENIQPFCFLLRATLQRRLIHAFSVCQRVRDKQRVPHHPHHFSQQQPNDLG